MTKKIYSKIAPLSGRTLTRAYRVLLKAKLAKLLYSKIAPLSGRTLTRAYLVLLKQNSRGYSILKLHLYQRNLQVLRSEQGSLL